MERYVYTVVVFQGGREGGKEGFLDSPIDGDQFVYGGRGSVAHTERNMLKTKGPMMTRVPTRSDGLCKRKEIVGKKTKKKKRRRKKKRKQ